MLLLIPRAGTVAEAVPQNKNSAAVPPEGGGCILGVFQDKPILAKSQVKAWRGTRHIAFSEAVSAERCPDLVAYDHIWHESCSIPMLLLCLRHYGAAGTTGSAVVVSIAHSEEELCQQLQRTH